ncbi:hypothetical protein ZWY2020_038710 [Hordeum vulgare]|nr:hypothetical protein ZWY2020_038710 [Hordeum vulgare]
MDDAGELRLPRKKGTKRAPPSAPPPRGRDRFESLWRDYHDLLKETEAKKRRLEADIGRLGLRFSARFLRKKYSSFAKDDSEQARHRLKKRKNAEGAYCQDYQDHPEAGMHDQAGVNEDIMTSNVNLSVYRIQKLPIQ